MVLLWVGIQNAESTTVPTVPSREAEDQMGQGHRHFKASISTTTQRCRASVVFLLQKIGP